MCFNNFLNMCTKTLNDSYFQTEGVSYKSLLGFGVKKVIFYF